MPKKALALLFAALLAACAATTVDLPAITEAPRGEHDSGRVVWHDLLTTTPEATRRFYRELFGWTFERPGIDLGFGGDDSWFRWLGFQERLDGFDPTLLNRQSNPLGSFLTLGFRLLRLVIVVPLVEEFFWRGFLMRWLIDGGNRWDRLPIGTFAWPSFLITTVSFALVHQTTDWSVALIYGALAGWVTVRTRSLGAVVLMHAVANLVLGLYILKTGFWGLW